MSIASEIERISGNVQSTIDTIRATGVTVPEGANSDDLPSLAQALATTKQDKLTGTAGQVVGFDESGNAEPQNELRASMLRGGANSVLSSPEAISISPAYNGMGFAINRGAVASASIDGTELPIDTNKMKTLFDGKQGTFIRFQDLKNYCTDELVWSENVQYQAGDFALVYENAGYNNYKYFRAIQNNKNENPNESSEYWENVSYYDEYTSNNYVLLTNMDVVITITNLPKSIRYENGVSLYWRAVAQKPTSIKIEMQDDSTQDWVEVAYDTAPDGSVQQYYTGNAKFSGNVTAIRFTFRNNKNSIWTALTQIAITGLVGGLEGTVLNLGGGAMYGNIGMNNYKIVDVANGTSSYDAVNLSQLNEKQNKITGTAGQIVGFDSQGNAVAQDAPESGMTQTEADGRYLQLSGGTMTGALTLNGDPSADNQAANKAYVDSKAPKYVSVTLSASGWVSNSQAVTVTGVLADEAKQLIQPMPAVASQQAYMTAGIYCSGQAANSLTFTCSKVPTEDITIYVVITEVGA